MQIPVKSNQMTVYEWALEFMLLYYLCYEGKLVIKAESKIAKWFPSTPEEGKGKTLTWQWADRINNLAVSSLQSHTERTQYEKKESRGLLQNVQEAN